MQYQRNDGWIEIVCGSMFSGKTEELLRRIRRAEIAKKRLLVVKPQIDTRYGDERVAAHSNLGSAEAIAVASPPISTILRRRARRLSRSTRCNSSTGPWRTYAQRWRTRGSA